MRLFRDEEHVRRSYDVPGAVFMLPQLWTLAQRWYGDRLDTDWTPHDRQRNQADLAAAGLYGDFWQLPLPSSNWRAVAVAAVLGGRLASRRISGQVPSLIGPPGAR